MADAPLRIVTRTQGNNRALKEGAVQLPSARPEFVEIPVLVDAFRRMVRGLEFDVCEMSLTTYLCAREHGVRFTAIPVFLVRGFHHGAIVVDPARGITDPRQLEGQTVGVNRGFTVTTGVWARGVLAREYNVDLSSITWVRTAAEHVAEYELPPNVHDVVGDAPLPGRVSSGEFAAAIGVTDRAGLVPLIPDAPQAGFAALRERGHYPINHLIVVRDDVISANPGLARELFDAFAESKRAYLDRLVTGAIAEPTAADTMYRTVYEITGGDPLPYGLEPNRAVIEELVEHALEQRILTKRPDISSLFAAGTGELEG